MSQKRTLTKPHPTSSDTLALYVYNSVFLIVHTYLFHSPTGFDPKHLPPKTFIYQCPSQSLLGEKPDKTYTSTIRTMKKKCRFL